MAADSQESSLASEKQKTPEKKQWLVAGDRQKEKQSEIDSLPFMAGGFRINRKKVCDVLARRIAVWRGTPFTRVGKTLSGR